MRQKGFKEIIIAGVLVAGLALFLIVRSGKESNVPDLVKKHTNIPEITSTPKLNCAKAGDGSTEYDAMIDKNAIVIHCCEGLKNIQKKPALERSPSGKYYCVLKQGPGNTFCAPCGNGKCDTKYEDICNCPDDCK